jgi:hypothetical protein
MTVLAFSDIVIGEVFSEHVIYEGGSDTEHPRTETSTGVESDSGRAPKHSRSGGLVQALAPPGAAYAGCLAHGLAAEYLSNRV